MSKSNTLRLTAANKMRSVKPAKQIVTSDDVADIMGKLNGEIVTSDDVTDAIAAWNAETAPVAPKAPRKTRQAKADAKAAALKSTLDKALEPKSPEGDQVVGPVTVEQVRAVLELARSTVEQLAAIFSFGPEPSLRIKASLPGQPAETATAKRGSVPAYKAHITMLEKKMAGSTPAVKKQLRAKQAVYEALIASLN